MPNGSARRPIPGSRSPRSSGRPPGGAAGLTSCAMPRPTRAPGCSACPARRRTRRQKSEGSAPWGSSGTTGEPCIGAACGSRGADRQRFRAHPPVRCCTPCGAELDSARTADLRHALGHDASSGYRGRYRSTVIERLRGSSPSHPQAGASQRRRTSGGDANKPTSRSMRCRGTRRVSCPQRGQFRTSEPWLDFMRCSLGNGASPVGAVPITATHRARIDLPVCGSWFDDVMSRRRARGGGRCGSESAAGSRVERGRHRSSGAAHAGPAREAGHKVGSLCALPNRLAHPQRVTCRL